MRIKPGDRVCLTPEAVKGRVGGYTSPYRVGTVLRVVGRRGVRRLRSGSYAVAVRWDGNSTETTYGQAWLDLVARPSEAGRVVTMSVVPVCDDGGRSTPRKDHVMDLDKANLDRWITTEPEEHDPLDEGDPAIIVANLVTEEERVQILARLSLLNGGRTEGIHLADALTIMLDSDAMLSTVDPMAAAWAEMGTGGDWTAAHSMACYVLRMLDRPVNTDAVERFLDRRFIEVEPEEEPAPERTVSFYRAGSLIRGAEFLGDRDYAVEGHEVVACNECCALVLDDAEMANREQHARIAHGLGATR